jgi:hypothetical protein
MAPRIRFPSHALDRLEERSDVTIADARRELLEALAAGRVCTRKPRVLVGPGRRPRSPMPSVRFAWSVDYALVFVLERRRLDGERAWIVKTVLTPIGGAGPHRNYDSKEVERDELAA